MDRCLLTMWLALLVVLLFALDAVSTQTPSEDILRQEAIQRLSKVFEMEQVPRRIFRRSPPEYMTTLYNQVAYNDGISKNPNPHEADIVRGFLDKASFHQSNFVFNISHLASGEDILDAEFHIFLLRPQSTSGAGSLSRNHLMDLRLYYSIEESSDNSLQLLHQRRLSVHHHGWLVFNVGAAVQESLNASISNIAFTVRASTRDGQSLNGTRLRFAQRDQHHDSKQPVLVAFTDKAQSSWHAAPTGPERISGSVDDSDMDSARQSYIQFLNEGFRAEQGVDDSQRMRQYMSPEMHEQLNLELTRSRRHRRSLRSKKSKRSNFNRFSRRRKKSCQRQELYVDFDAIGWSGWIISPKGYNAYHCKGSCPFPLGQNQKPTNHATVQSIVHALRIGKDVEMACCVPNKLFSISLLYFDDDENVILKQYDDMVAASCGCQ